MFFRIFLPCRQFRESHQSLLHGKNFLLKFNFPVGITEELIFLLNNSRAAVGSIRRSEEICGELNPGFSLWTSGHGFHHYRSAFRIQFLDLWTWIPPLQVSIQNSVFRPLDMDSTITGKFAEFSLWTPGYGFRHYRSPCKIQPLDMDSATVSGPLKMDPALQVRMQSLWTSGHRSNTAG